MSDDLDIFIKAIGSQLKSYPDICKAQKTVDADKETMQVQPNTAAISLWSQRRPSNSECKDLARGSICGNPLMNTIAFRTLLVFKSYL